MFKRLAAEFFGTFWLVFAILGTALLAAGVPIVGVGFLGVSFAAGFAVLTMAYAVGPVSGGHFNPAVSFGLAVAGRFEWRDVVPYWIAQVVGGIAAAAILHAIASGRPDFEAGGFASNGYGILSPGGYSLWAVVLSELVLTAGFVMVVLGSTSRAASPGFAPIAIGMALALAHLIGIPVSNGSFNPARSIAAAIFSQNGALGQIWLFILVPLLGGAVGALLWRYVVSPGEPIEQLGRVE